MIELIKEGRWVKIENCTPEVDKLLSKELSYMKKGAYFMANPLWGLVKLYSEKKHAFPSGLLTKVKNCLNKNNIKYDIKDNSSTIDFINSKEIIKNITNDTNLRDYQKEALIKLDENRGGVLQIPTAGGKTITICKYMNIMSNNQQFLVIVTTKDLVIQWQDEIAKWCPNCKVDVKTYQSLINHIEILDKYNIIIFDENHHVAAHTLFKIGMNCKKAQQMIGISATPERDDGENMKIEAILGPVVYKIPIEELVKKGYIVKGVVNIINLDKEKQPLIELTDDYKDIVNKYIINNSYRNNIISDLAYATSAKGTILVLVDSIVQGEILYNIIKPLVERINNQKCIFVHGKSKERKEIFEDVKKGVYNVVIATKIYGEGVSIDRLTTLILAGGGKSTIKILQQVGRMLRLFKDKNKAIIYDFADTSKYLKTHFNKRIKIYKENGFEIIYP